MVLVQESEFTFIKDKDTCSAICEVFQSQSEFERKKPTQERYTSKLLHSNENIQDPYEVTGFVRYSLYFTQIQKEKMKNFPLVPNKIKVDNKNKKETKLVYTVNDIGDYCIFSEFLKQMLENDWCSLDKVHEVVLMKLGPVMRSFIDTKTQKRQECENTIRECKQQIELDPTQKIILASKLSAACSKKDVAKLDNNSCYGKTLQSDEKYDTSVIVSD